MKLVLPPQFPSKYLFAEQNSTWYYGTTHIDLTDDKLFASMDVTTSSIKLNFKSDVSISNLTFDNKKKLTAKLSNPEDNLFYVKQAIGKTTFDVTNKCIIIDLTETGFTNYDVFFNQSLKLLNVYLKDCDFMQLSEEMKIIDIEGKRKLFYLSEKELSDENKLYLTTPTSSVLNDKAFLDFNTKYLFFINPVLNFSIGYIFSDVDNKCVSISGDFNKNYYRLYTEWSNYNSSNPLGYYAINDDITFDTLYTEFLTMHTNFFADKSYLDSSVKAKFDETATALKNKTDSEKQTLVTNAKTNAAQYCTYTFDSYFWTNQSTGYTDTIVTKIFSSIIYSKGMYTLKNPPKMNISFEVDV